MRGCKLKGDDLANEKTWTAGILSVDSHIEIRKSHFENFKSGAIMIQAREGNRVTVEENEIMSCDTNGVYVQGKLSRPIIKDNYFGFNKCPAITTNI